MFLKRLMSPISAQTYHVVILIISLLIISGCKDPLSFFSRMSVGERVYSTILNSESLTFLETAEVVEEAFNAEGFELSKKLKSNWWAKFIYENTDIQILIDVTNPQLSNDRLIIITIAAHLQYGIDKKSSSVIEARESIERTYERIDRLTEIETKVYFNGEICWTLSQYGKRESCEN